MDQDNQKEKLLYIATSKSLTGLAKMGMSADPNQRCKTLSTGVPEPYIVRKVYKLPQNVTDRMVYNYIKIVCPEALYFTDNNRFYKMKEFINLENINLEDLFDLIEAFISSYD